MADCLYPMTVGIQREGAVIVSVIVRSEPGRAIVVASGGKSCHMKGIDGRVGGSAKAEMRAGMGVLMSTSLVMVNSTPSEPGAAPQSEPRPLPKSTMRTSPSGCRAASWKRRQQLRFPQERQRPRDIAVILSEALPKDIDNFGHLRASG